MDSPDCILHAKELHKVFKHGRKRVTALNGVDFSIYPGQIVGLLGPDGAGKTTLLRLLTGLLKRSAGELRILSLDPGNSAREIQSRIGYMPQKFGLYEDLTVLENMELFAAFHAVPREERQTRFAKLLEITDLERFSHRLAGQLSGGMKQKLALLCTLVGAPAVLLLDEPTVGVDPLSRRELWKIIQQLVKERNLTVLVSTAYLDESSYCDYTLVLYQGRLIAEGTPQEIADLARDRCFAVTAPENIKPRHIQRYLAGLESTIYSGICGRTVHWVTRSAPDLARFPWPCQARTGDFQSGFMVQLCQAIHPEATARGCGVPPSPEPQPEKSAAAAMPVVVEVHDLVRRFGNFVAVDHVNFEVRKGEIFGLLGPNGAGKSTTFRMLCGLLVADEGVLQVAGNDLRHAAASARLHLGYVAQKFSLYGDLTILENLSFFAGAYGLDRARSRRQCAKAIERFQLGEYLKVPAKALPGGYKQRLSMACALLHEPEILFLDEPTSGADPLARLEFWQRINEVADSGVTIIITTHFLEEAEYCDRMLIMMAGKVLACGSPDEIRTLAASKAADATLEEAFITITEQFRSRGGAQ